MAEISKTPKKGLSLPEHYDPSVDKLRENMTLIDSILQKANPNDLSSINDGESNIDTLTTTGRYLVSPTATGSPVSGFAGIVDVFRAGDDILQEWRSINPAFHEYRRYSSSSGVSWGDWIKCWNAGNDGDRSGLDADLLDGIHALQFARYGESYFITSGTPTPTGVGSASMYTFIDTDGSTIGEGSNVTYGIMQIYSNSSNYVRIAVSMSSGKVYRQTSGTTAWSEIGSSIPVVSSDPTSPSEGQLWILTD